MALEREHEGRVERPGRFLEVDADGWLVNDTSVDRVPSDWRPLVDRVVGAYQGALGDRLHSVWLRGSAVSGQVVPGVSDLDTMALGRLPAGPDGLWVPQPELEARCADWTAPGCTGVEVCVGSVEALHTERAAFLRFLLATGGCRIAGEPVDLPRYRPDRSACFVSGHVAGALRVTRHDRPTDDDLPGLSRWLAKTLVRAGGELVMDRERRYARDLWPNVVAFRRHHPERGAWMDRALEAAVDPTGSEAELDFLVEELGPWLLDALERAGLAEDPPPPG